MFKLNKRGRAKCITAAEKVTGNPVHGYGMGLAHFRWTTSAIVLIAVFGAIFVIGLLAGVILFPGFFLAIAFWQQVRPRRGVAIADSDMVVMATSWLTAKPNKVVMRAPFAQLDTAVAEDEGSKRLVHLGGDRVSFKTGEFQELLSHVPAMPEPVPVAPAPKPRRRPLRASA